MTKASKPFSPRTQKTDQPFPIVRPHAAGIDIGDSIHAVAVPPGSCPKGQETVRIFGTMTVDLIKIAGWLKQCQVDTVAMESTGVYWKPLCSVLVKKGFDVFLVNARNVKNVSGRKTDESDAAWLQKLHSCGLLSSSYLPEEEQEVLRTLVRYRKVLRADASRFVLRIQKSLELMNVKIHTVIRDITGVTGTAIIEAIINGERNAEMFLQFVHPRVRADRDTIVKSLEGTWQEEHLFTLDESYKFYKYYQDRIRIVEAKIENQLQKFEASLNEGELVSSSKEKSNSKAKRKNKNNPRFDTRKYLQTIYKVDIMAIPGLSEDSALQILAEIGTDLSKWPTVKQFVSWLNLCPNNKKSGGKLISSKLLKKTPSPATMAFRAIANAVQRGEHWLGDYFRRKKAKGGNKYAIVATAQKIAIIFYKMVQNQTEFQPQDQAQYRIKYTERKIHYLEAKLQQLRTQQNELQT